MSKILPNQNWMREPHLCVFGLTEPQARETKAANVAKGLKTKIRVRADGTFDVLVYRTLTEVEKKQRSSYAVAAPTH